jgi:hypothetical protein
LPRVALMTVNLFRQSCLSPGGSLRAFKTRPFTVVHRFHQSALFSLLREFVPVASVNVAEPRKSRLNRFPAVVFARGVNEGGFRAVWGEVVEASHNIQMRFSPHPGAARAPPVPPL